MDWNDGNQGYEPGLDYWKSLSGYNHSFRFCFGLYSGLFLFNQIEKVSIRIFNKLAKRLNKRESYLRKLPKT